MPAVLCTDLQDRCARGMCWHQLASMLQAVAACLVDVVGDIWSQFRTGCIVCPLMLRCALQEVWHQEGCTLMAVLA